MPSVEPKLFWLYVLIGPCAWFFVGSMMWLGRRHMRRLKAQHMHEIPLFPGIPKGHSAMGMVTLNLTANMLGLGNAATPFGIKAMERCSNLGIRKSRQKESA